MNKFTTQYAAVRLHLTAAVRGAETCQFSLLN